MKNHPEPSFGFLIITSRLISLAILLFPCLILCQSRSDLENERNKIIRTIEKTSSELVKTSHEKNQKIIELNSLEEKINNREKLLSNIGNSIRAAEADILHNDTILIKLATNIEEIKNQYHQLLRYSYLKKLGTNRWAYILSSESLNDAFLRWRYTKQFEEYTVNKRSEYHSMQQSIDEKNNIIKEAKAQQESLLKSESKQISLLNQEEQEQKRLLTSLSRDESKLKEKLNRNKREREKLNDAIENAILNEMSKRKVIETPDASAKVIELTGAFEENKGKLPWPVTTGKIKSKFGIQAHPTVKGLKINNNGINIQCEIGARVSAIYAGKVIGVTKIPGYDNMVIIQHGDYYTVYSRLNKVVLSKDDMIKTGDTIGTLAPEANELHIEFWKNKNKIDPQVWLQKK